MGRCCCSFEHGGHHARDGQALDWPNADGQGRPGQDAASCAKAAAGSATGRRGVVQSGNSSRSTRVVSRPAWAGLIPRPDARLGQGDPSHSMQVIEGCAG